MPLAFRNFAAEAEGSRRVHPWTRAERNPSWVYLDFKGNPSAVRSALEDLRPYSGRRFAEDLCNLIEWMNGSGRLFETNDFAFRGPRRHTDYHNPWPLRCDGRLMFLFRELERNCIRAEIDAAVEFLLSKLNEQPALEKATVGLSLHPTTYSDLHPDPKLGADGLQFQFTFFAYGRNEVGCFSAMSDLVRSVRRGLLVVDRCLTARKWLTDIDADSH